MKAFLYKLLDPGSFWCLLCLIFSIPALIFIFSNQLNQSFYAGIVYAISTYTLIIGSWKLIVVCRKLKKQLYSYPLTHRFLCDGEFRIRQSIAGALCINLIYAAIKFYSGIYYSSTWLITLALYYTILAVMRFLLVIQFNSHEIGKQPIKEQRMAGVCGLLLLLLTVVLAAAAMQMILQNQTYDYPGSLIYAAAAYAFYSVGVSLYNWFKYRLQNSPLLFAAKNCSLASALVSMLAMQTAMLTRFGSDEHFKMVMNIFSSTAVCLIVLILSLFMIRKSMGIKKLNKE